MITSKRARRVPIVTMQKYPDFDHCVFPQKNGLSLRVKSSAAQSAVQDATSSSQQQRKSKVRPTHKKVFVALIYYILFNKQMKEGPHLISFHREEFKLSACIGGVYHLGMIHTNRFEI